MSWAAVQEMAKNSSLTSTEIVRESTLYAEDDKSVSKTKLLALQREKHDTIVKVWRGKLEN